MPIRMHLSLHVERCTTIYYKLLRCKCVEYYIARMELKRVLHMKGGNEETSYAKSSYVAKKTIEMTKPIWEKAIVQLVSQKEHELPVIESKLCVADLGCGSGPTALAVVSELIITSRKILGGCSSKEQVDQLEYHVYLNDLPANDFNNVFMSLPTFYQELEQQVELNQGCCFVLAVPGSFYGRLFPSRTLHFIHSSYSLYWLSQVPEGVEANKRNIYLTRTSTSAIVNAYKDQFQKDTTLFLQSRSQELVKGGKMVLTYWGRPIDDPTCTQATFVWDLLSTVLNQLINEEIVKEEKVEAFNMPVYHPSSEEVVKELEREGSFVIDSVNVSHVDVDSHHNRNDIMDNESACKKGDMPARLVRSLVESLMHCYFDTVIIDEIFQRYSKLLEDMLNEQKVLVTNVTISITKK